MKKTASQVITPDQIPERFVVRQKKTMLLLGLIMILVCGGVVVCNLFSGAGDVSDLLTAGVICLLIGAVVLVKYRNHRIEVNGEEVCYVATNGQKTCFHASEMSVVRRDVSDNPKVFSADGRLLARFDRNMENFALMLAYLKAHGVKAA